MTRPCIAHTHHSRASTYETMSSLKIAQLFGIAGKTALVTGGGAGIGAMITQTLIEVRHAMMVASRFPTCGSHGDTPARYCLRTA